MRFTKEQYESAIKALTLAIEQLDPDGKPCSICGDEGHQAFECGHNPLLAIEICKSISKQAESLHNTLHYLAGWQLRNGEIVGPSKIR